MTRSGSDGRGRPGHDHHRRWAGPARGSLVGRFTTALVFLCCIETGRLVVAQTLPANVTVRRTTDGLTTRLDIAPRDGRFRVDDIVRSLAEVNGLDTSVFNSRYLPGSFSATSWRTGGYVAALNRMLPRGVDVQYVKRRSAFGSVDRGSKIASTSGANDLREGEKSVVPVLVPRYLAGSVSDRIIPQDLARVIAKWDELPDAFKAGILALVQAAPSNAERAPRD